MSWRAALRLGRVSNLPTVWSNVAAGIVLAGGRITPAPLLLLLVALSLAYVAGMYLNDAFDRDVDARERPTRPIPSGEATTVAVFAAGFAMLALAQVPLAVVGYCLDGGQGGRPLLSGLTLAGAIVYYDARHKSDPLSPLVMGLCRVLVYVTAAVAVTPHPAPAVFWGAAVLFAYLIGVTYAAKQENLSRITNLWPLTCLAVPFIYTAGNAFQDRISAVIYLGFLGWTTRAAAKLLKNPANIPGAITMLIAGIAFVDALLIAGQGAVGIASLALGAVALTRLLQRHIAGT